MGELLLECGKNISQYKIGVKTCHDVVNSCCVIMLVIK